MRVTSGIVSTLQQKTTTGFAPNDRGVASDDLVVDNPMSGRADCTNVGISGHCGLPPALTIAFTTGSITKV